MVSPEAGIVYIVTRHSGNTADAEAISDAVDRFRHSAVDSDSYQPMEERHPADDAVSIILKRTLAEGAHPGYVQEVEARMRQGIEANFSEADRARLSRYFGGRATKVHVLLDE